MNKRKTMGRRIHQIFKKPRGAGFLSKVSLLVVTGILCLGLMILSMGIKSHFVSELKINADNLALGYNHSLTKTVEASSVVSQLINEKLEIVSGFISNFGQEMTNDDLRKIARVIDVEEIDIYEESGEIILSNTDAYIGWVPPNEHPVRDFIHSGATSHIDPIRNNTITGHAVLYGYARMEDGHIVQVGINAKVLQNLISEFEVNDILKEMLSHKDVLNVKYISNSRVVLGSTITEELGKVLPLNDAEASLYDAIGLNVFQRIPEKDHFDVFEPVYINEQKAGDLVIGLSLVGTRNAVKSLTRSVAVVLIMVYLAAVVMLYLLHSKNRKLFHLAYVDDLTRLPNVKHLRRVLRYELNKKPGKSLALILIHIPEFSRFTIARGYEKGNVIFRNIARYIKGKHISGGELFRFSDEKFMLLIHDYERKESLVEIMEDLNHAVPLEDGENIDKRLKTLTFGVLEITERYRKVGEALVDVMIALNNVGEDSPKPFAFFDHEMEARMVRENLIDEELRMAILNPLGDIISLAYQPLVHGEKEHVVSFEALARMRSKHYEFVSPMEFIAIAEKNGLMVSLGQIILEKALGFVKLSESRGCTTKIAVNISTIQIFQEDFVDMVKSTLERIGVDPSCLELEITESVFLSSYDLVNMKLSQLREMGVRIAIDDFGTGYSSFARLKELHVDMVKIDQYFISKISSLPEDHLITADIINMIHKFGLKTVAEGVETEEERDYLRRAGCDYLQGYLYSKPLPEEKALSYIKCHQINGHNNRTDSESARQDA